MGGEEGRGPRLVRSGTGTSTPIAVQPPRVPSLLRCFKRESADVAVALEGTRRRLLKELTCVATLPDSDPDISWDDIEEIEFASEENSVGVPQELLRLLVLPSPSEITAEDFARRCGGRGPYFGARRRDEGYGVHVYDEEMGNALADWGDGEFFDSRRWERVLAAWRERSLEHLDEHFAQTHAELERLRAFLVKIESGDYEDLEDAGALRLPPELLRRLLGQPQNVCPSCFSVPPVRFVVDLGERDCPVELRISCPGCSKGRPDARECTDPDDRLGLVPFHEHAVSHWDSWETFVSPERWESTYQAWLAGE